MTKLRTDWSDKMHMYLGYRVTEDEESLHAFNRCIKAIIQSEKMKDNVVDMAVRRYMKQERLLRKSIRKL